VTATADAEMLLKIMLAELVLRTRQVTCLRDSAYVSHQRSKRVVVVNPQELGLYFCFARTTACIAVRVLF
jgi:hypothetical protein